LPRQTKADAPHLQAVDDVDWSLDLPPEQKAIVMEERELTVIAYRQLGAPLQYCLPREDKPLAPDESEKFHITDDDRLWIDATRKQKLNALIFLQLGVIEVRFFGPDQTLAQCFFQACVKLNLATRYAFGRASKDFAQSVLFKLRDDEAARLDEEYSGFKPRPFMLDDERRGVIINYAPIAKKGSNARLVAAIAPGSLLWHENGTDYDLIKWRDASGQGPAARYHTQAPTVDFFSIVRAAAFASILNIIKTSTWESAPARWSFSEWLARVVKDGQAINANIVFSKSARAIITEPAHAELLIALICEAKGLPEKREECREKFHFARKRLEADPTRHDVAGWTVIRQWFGGDAHDALRTVLNVGADSTLLEDFAERYLFCAGEFIDRKAFREGRAQYIFSRETLTLLHAPDQILTKKKPVEAFPIFIKSKMRQDVTGVELHPDSEAGAILRVTRQGALIANDEYAPEHSRLVFNEWAGLYVKPAKTIERALEAECIDKLDHMLSLVARTKPRAAWVKAHFGWTLKHPGRKQQVALVCTGDQGTGKSFLCTDFAEAVFGQYAGKASVKALENQFYIPSYVRKLWVTHDEVVSKSETIEIVKDLIRSTRISGEFKNKDPATYTTYARLAFTSNETNPGLSRGGADRGLFQVTSITAAGEGILPGEFQDRVRKEIAPFYESFYSFLERDDVRQAYVKLLIDCAPEKISEVEDLTHSAMRDADVASEQLTPTQLVAKEILENGTIYGGWDIAMPFRHSHLTTKVKNVANNMGLRQTVLADAVRDLWVHAGLLEFLPSGELLFKFKIGGLQRLFSDFISVPLRSHWQLKPNDDMPNDYREGDDFVPWKGRNQK
jgi:hypothetical protein